MRDVGEKIDNSDSSAGVVVADEYNSVFDELRGAVKPFMPLNENDNNQLVKSIDIASKGMFYNDVGSVNAVHLRRRATREEVETLFDGMIVMFSPANNNTGESTLKVNGLESKPMKFKGEKLEEGVLLVGLKYIAIYSSSLNSFDVDIIANGVLQHEMVDKQYVDELEKRQYERQRFQTFSNNWTESEALAEGFLIIDGRTYFLSGNLLSATQKTSLNSLIIGDFQNIALLYSQNFILETIDATGHYANISDRGFGSLQGDAIRNITGVIGGVVAHGTSGVISDGGRTIGVNTGSQWGVNTVSIDASRTVPTAAENRPKNINTAKKWLFYIGK